MVQSRPIESKKLLNVSPDQREFIEWLVTPRDTRIAKGLPTTQDEYAHAHNMSTRTPTTWKAQPVFREAWDKRIQQLAIDPQNTQDCLNAMLERAIGGSVTHFRAYMEWVDRFRPPAEPELPKSLEEMTPEELDALILAEAQRAKAELAEPGGE